MNLDDTQKQKVAGWLEEGLKLSAIQNRIASEFGVRMTYMEVRFLLDDLKLKPKEREPAPSAPVEIGKSDAPKGGSAVPPRPEKSAPQPAAPGGSATVSVTVDQVTRPGALVSGGVTFSDGNSAQWYLDQTGRLGVVAKQQGYRPSQDDVMAFQAELQNQLAKLGY